MEIEKLHHGGYVCTKGCHGPFDSASSRFTMAGQVYGHDPVLLRKVWHLGVPIAAVTAPTVHKDESRFSRAVHFIANWDTVRRKDRRG